MILARPICLDRPSDLELALLRMGLPTPAREYLLGRLPHAQLLLTGLAKPQLKLLKELCRSGEGGLHPAFLAGDAERRPDTALLSGRADQFGQLLGALKRASAEPELQEALAHAIEAEGPAPTRIGAREFAWGSRTYVMGVVNVTPDSFSDGGKALVPEQAVAHALALAEAGADLLDLGAESTRPGAAPVSRELEWERLEPVLRELAAKVQVPISVDTAKAWVAERAIGLGACLVNDVTALEDPGMAELVARTGAACCLMHMQGTPRTMQQAPAYEDVVGEVLSYLGGRVAVAQQGGVAPERILVDPGIGFGKSFEHNLFLLRRAGELKALGRPVLIGTSRKAFLGALTGRSVPSERLAGTLGSVAALAVTGGADIVRVHDVCEVREALAAADAIARARGGGTLYGGAFS